MKEVMKLKEYQRLSFTVTEFEAEDIITTSTTTIQINDQNQGTPTQYGSDWVYWF